MSTREYEVLANISRIITSSSNIEEVYQRLMAEVRNLIAFDGAAINLINYEGNTFTHISSVNVPDRRPAEVYPLAGTATAEVARIRRARVFQSEDSLQLARDFPGLAPLIDAGFYSFCVVPLISHGEVIGSIGFHTVKVNAYSERDRLMAEQIALQIVGAVANSQLYTERERSSALLEKQKGLLEMIAKGVPLSETLIALVSFVEERCPGLACSVLLLQEDGKHLRVGAAPHLPESYRNALEGAEISPPYLGPCGKAAFEAAPVLVSNISEDTRWQEEWRDLALDCGMRSCYSIPILSSDGSVLGTFATYSFSALDPRPADSYMMGVATQIAGIAIERYRTEQRLREESRRIEVLNRIGASLVSELDIQKTVQAATDAATELTGAQFGAFFFNVVNEDGESYMMYTLSGAPREVFENFPQPRNSALFKDTFEGKGIVRLGNVAKDPRYGKNPPYYGVPEGHLPVKSYLAVPVVSRSGEVQGGLFLGHGEEDRFTERHERLAAGIAGWASICIDNARLYQRIEEQATDLQTLLDSITEGVVEATADLKISRVNAYALKVLGVSEEQILGQPVREVFRQSDRENQEPIDLDALVKEAIYSERTHKIEEAWLELGSGKAIPIALTIAPEEVEYSGQHRAVLIFDDMSSRHEVNELRNNIISVVSHELRTPLHYIKSYSSSLLQTDVEWDEDSRLDMIRTIDKGANRLTKLVNDLLEISRLQSGKIPMELAPISPEIIVNEAVEQIRPLISGHKLAVAATPGLPEVVADQSRVHQVILNLVQNASKYSPPGNTIYVGTSLDEGYISFSVKDEGIGIAPEFLDKIFDKFTRLDTIRFTETPGVGLGLAISKAIVEAHGGKLWAYSEGEGKGTTFYFTLPIAESAMPPPADPLRPLSSSPPEEERTFSPPEGASSLFPFSPPLGES